MANLVNLLFSESESDSDGERLRKRKVYKERRISSVDNYRQLYRFNQETVIFLRNHFLPLDDQETRGGALSGVKKMECFLRYASDPGYQVRKNFMFSQFNYLNFFESFFRSVWVRILACIKALCVVLFGTFAIEF